MAAGWGAYTFSSANGWEGLRFSGSAPRPRLRVDEFAGTDGIIVTDFGQGPRQFTLDCWMSEDRRFIMEDLVGDEGELELPSGAKYSGMVLESMEFSGFFLIDSTQYCRARLTWIG